jgi:hypothetical protein
MYFHVGKAHPVSGLTVGVKYDRKKSPVRAGRVQTGQATGWVRARTGLTVPGKPHRRTCHISSVSSPPDRHSESVKNFVMKNPIMISKTERSARSRSHRRISFAKAISLTKLK